MHVRLAWAALACGALGCGALGPPPLGADGPVPRVVSVSPADGAVGVAADAKVVITFDRPMDPRETQAAFGSAEIESPIFEWDPTFQILTITPGKGLAYAEGNDVSLPARRHAFTVNTTARAAGAGRLAQTFRSAFTTLRRITLSLKSDHILDGYARGDGEPATCIERTMDSDKRVIGACVGHSMKGNSPYVGLFTFPLTPLPREIHTVETATLSAYQYWIDGRPYPNLGVVLVEHLIYDSKKDAASIGALRRVGPLSTEETAGWKHTEPGAMTPAVREDLQLRAARKDRTQVRLAFSMPDWALAFQGHVAKFYTSMVELAAPDAAEPDRNDKYPRLVVTFLAP